jgi:hypothetical protein
VSKSTGGLALQAAQPYSISHTEHSAGLTLLPLVCYPLGEAMARTSYSLQERAVEKQRARAQDAQDLASGKKTREELRRKNGLFAFPRHRVRINYSSARAVV